MFNDIDDANASIVKAAASDDLGLVTVSVTGDALTLHFLPNQNGDANVTVTATSNGQTATDVFTVSVTEANDSRGQPNRGRIGPRGRRRGRRARHRRRRLRHGHTRRGAG